MNTLSAKYLFDLCKKSEDIQTDTINKFMYKDKRGLTEKQYFMFRVCDALFRQRIENHAWGKN